MCILYIAWYNYVVIINYANPDTEEILVNGLSRKYQSVLKAAILALTSLNRAVYLRDLETPPGNRLKKLYGNWAYQYSIRVNDKYRLCFEWKERNPDPDGKPSPEDA